MKIAIATLFSAIGLVFGQPAGSISGTVRESNSGQPIEHATVSITLDPKALRTETDAAGHYRLTDIAAGDYTLVAHTTPDGPRPVATSVQLRSGQNLESIDFRLDLSTSVTGVVLDDEKKPVSGATVWIIKRQYAFGGLHYFPAGRARTNVAGEYTMPATGIEAGRGFLLYATTDPERYAMPISDAPIDSEKRKTSLAPMYYPNSPDPAGAQVITLRVGERREHIDFVMIRRQSYCLSASLLAQGAPGVMPFCSEARRSGPAGERSSSFRVVSRHRADEFEFATCTPANTSFPRRNSICPRA